MLLLSSCEALTEGLEVIKLEYSLKLKTKRNDWLLADKSDILNLLEINGGSEHRYSSSMSGSLL